MIWFNKGRIPDGRWPFLSTTFAGIRNIEEDLDSNIDLTEGTGQLLITGCMQAYRQAVLRRVLDLTRGVIVSWNEGALISSVVCARSLLETLAMFHSFMERASKECENHNWEAIGRLVDAYAFSTMSGPEKKNKSPERPAGVRDVVIKFIQRTAKDKTQFWEQICDEAHPNGNRMLQYGGLLQDMQYLEQSASENEKRLFPAIYNALYSCCWLINAIEDFDILLEEIRNGGRLNDSHPLIKKRKAIDQVVAEVSQSMTRTNTTKKDR